MGETLFATAFINIAGTFIAAILHNIFSTIVALVFLHNTVVLNNTVVLVS